MPATTARPPWRWNSAISSPVSLRGPGNQSTRASSMRSPPRDPSGAVRRRSPAWRGGGGSRPVRQRIASRASGPETRTTAMGAFPGAVAGAKIVALVGSLLVTQPSAFRRQLVLGFQHQPLHPPALDQMQRQDLVHFLAGPHVVPDPLGIDHHRRSELAAIEAAAAVDAHAAEPELLRPHLHVVAQAFGALGLAAAAGMARWPLVDAAEYMRLVEGRRIAGPGAVTHRVSFDCLCRTTSSAARPPRPRRRRPASRPS